MPEYQHRFSLHLGKTRILTAPRTRQKNDVVLLYVFAMLCDMNFPPLTSTMITERCWEGLHKLLLETESVPGDVVELGCHVGCTSIRIAMVISALGKQLHAFDSFQGLPVPSIHDGDHPLVRWRMHSVTKEKFIQLFQKHEVPLPVIREGFFSETVPDLLPEQISFAFIDTDQYESMRLGIRSVLPRMSIGGVIAIHDYKDPRFPGIVKACDELLGPLFADPDELGFFRVRP